MMRRLPLIPCYLTGFFLGLTIGVLDDLVGRLNRKRMMA